MQTTVPRIDIPTCHAHRWVVQHTIVSDPDNSICLVHIALHYRIRDNHQPNGYQQYRSADEVVEMLALMVDINLWWTM